MITKAQCSVEGCVNSRRASGLCASHYRIEKFKPSPTRGSSPPGRVRRTIIQELISEIKLKNGCKDCGYNKHPQALEFDHLPGTKKSFNLSRAGDDGKSWDEISSEIDKCEVVCANCHRIRTANRRGG